MKKHGNRHCEEALVVKQITKKLLYFDGKLTVGASSLQSSENATAQTKSLSVD